MSEDENKPLVTNLPADDQDDEDFAKDVFERMQPRLQEAERESIQSEVKYGARDYPNLIIPKRVSVAAPSFVNEQALTPEQYKAKKNSLLSVEVIRTLDEKQLKELQKPWSAFRQATLFSVSVALMGFSPLVETWVVWDPVQQRKVMRHIVQTPYLFSFIFSFFIAVAIKCPKGGTKALRDMFDPKVYLLTLPIASSFVIADLAAARVQLSLDGALWKVLTQAKLFLNAIFAYVILGRKQSTTQTLLLASCSLAILAYAMQDMKNVVITDWLALIFACITVVATVICGIFSEGLMKKMPHDFITQMAQNRLASLTTLSVLTIVQCSSAGDWHRFPFGGWTGAHIILVFSDMARSWTSMLIVKKLDSVWKTLAMSLALGITYLSSCALLPPASAPTFKASQFIIVLALSINIIAYAGAKSDSSKLLQLTADAQRHVAERKMV
eukprot:Gregarina_sp_Poly_1__1053@NODE_125_length_13444_cov_91_472378_g111_i0_p4_GENE_NODE_125_length_13444_cov_91_472378_g111_i0NODE_125_length_13444_cov_91_472378_g111_i0_p4_ORF_typecomplete_len441_score63_06Nuc_sug_transp/PF04142_15/2_2e17CRTlike/PF08627_10/0_058SPC12/PF06645_13/2e03SPC12/PF06645_13/0_83SID1_RNA_chan/PF13965_6/2_6SID1_RNA_chan/PF13965_6/3_7e02_NODE_125_length_13444_cov_91_472378_g111_i027114033